ncbi:MAG: dipicolinate synthase subunit B [Bacillota bacterium]
MRYKGLRIGFGITGSFCTLEAVFKQIEGLLAEGAEIIPIVTQEVAAIDTRYGAAASWLSRLKELTGHTVLKDIVGVEPLGPNKLVDVVVIAPCTGNTLAKLANGITDNPVLMAAKAHLRNGGPVVIAVSTNDGLGLNARNLGTLLNTKNVYFVPFGQDNPAGKPNSLVAKMDMVGPTIAEALKGRQLQPVLVTYN